MNFKRIIICLSLFIQLSFSQHQHGIGEFFFTMEDNTIEIEIRVPAADALGFEYQPKTQEEKKQLSEKLKLFKITSMWLKFSEEANCKVITASSRLDSDKEENEDHHGHDHGHHHKETHFEIVGNYQFKCSDSKQLNRLSILIFDYLPNLSKINFTLVANQQTQGTLTKKNNAIKEF